MLDSHFRYIKNLEKKKKKKKNWATSRPMEPISQYFFFGPHPEKI